MNFKKLFFMLTFVVLFATTAFAQVYVATGGDDGFNTGASPSSPFRTIQKAIDVAPTGSTIYIEAGTYNSIVLPGEGAPITLATNRNFTFVGTAVGLFTEVILTDGFTLNNASAVVNFGASGTAKFNFGTSATALVLTAGTMNITVPANVVFGSGATLTITDGTLNGVPTKGTNLNVTFNGANAIASTSGFLPSTLGSGATLTVNKATGDVTIDNATLSVGFLVTSNAANTNITSDLTITANGDITNSGTGTLTIGTNSANVLTMTSTTGIGQIIVNGGGDVVVNASVTYNIQNAGTSATVGDTGGLALGNVFDVSAGSNLTVNGNLTFNNTNVASSDGKNATTHSLTLLNNGTGTLAINGNLTTPLSSVVFSNPTGGNNNAFVFVKIANTAAGAFSVRSAALRGATGTVGVTNNAAGLMTLGQSGDTFTTAYDVVQDNTGSRLVINAASTFSGAFNNDASTAGAKVTFNANATITGILTNAANIVLGSNTVTLSRTGAGTLANTGDIYSVTTATVGSGWLKFTGASPTITGAGNLPNVEINSGTSPAITTGATIYGNLNVTKANTAFTINGTSTVKGDLNMTLGNVTLGANLTVEGTFTMPQGTFTFGANTLNLKGNFNRTGGTIDAAAAGTGTLNFNGSAPQTFNPGVQMNVFNVTVNNTGTYLVNVIENDVVTMNGALIVLKDFTITTGKVVLGTSNVRMLQVLSGGIRSARFTNGGRGYSATGIGGLIFEGDGSNAAGAGDGAVLAGAQPYSNIYIRLTTPANNVYTLGAVTISGIITFDAGGLTWNQPTDAGDAFTTSTLTLSDVLVTPTVVINTDNTHGSPFLVDGGDLGAQALLFNLAATVYNLTYSGNTSLTMDAGDFVTTRVNNLSIQAGNTAAKTIQIFAANATIKGSLNVDNGETLNLFNVAARTLTSSGNTATHTINGTVSGAGTTFEITGTGATLTGGVGTGNASAINGTLLVDPATGGTFTSTGMKLFGALTINQAALTSNVTMNSETATVNAFTNTAGTTTLYMNSTAVTATGTYTVAAGNVTLTMNGAAAGTRTIGTNLSVTGGSLTLGSAIDVTGDVTHSGASTIALGNNNLSITGAYTHNNTATFTAGTGYVIAINTAAKNYTFTTTVTIPNFRVNGTNTVSVITNGFTVSNGFRMSAGTLALAALPLTITGNTIRYDGGTFTATAATGKISLQGTAPVFTAYANTIIPYLEVNSTGNVSFMTDDVATPTARTFSVTGTFTHTKGNIDLNINDIEITNIGGADGTYTTAATAGTITGSTGTNLGEVVFNGANGNGSLTLADNYSIQNFRSVSDVTKTDTKVLTVVNNFGLNGGDFTFTNSARLVLGDGATITRSGGVFDVIPTFGTTVNVAYTGVVNTNKELPTGTSILNNLTINAGGAVTFTADATVNGTLFLTAGTVDLTTNTKVLTIAENATINRANGAFGAGASDVPTATTYTLIYSGGGAAINTGVELISTKVTNLKVTRTANGVVLASNRTVGAFEMSPTGAGAANVYFALGTDAATRTLTVTGPVTINNGIVSTSDVTAAVSTNAGSLVAQGSVTVNGGNLGNLGTDNAAGIDGGLNLTFGGAIAQSLVLNGNITLPNLTLNSTGITAADAVVNVTGGNLTITNLLTFQNGILNMGPNTLVLPNPTGAANGGLAFDRSGVTASEFGHVVGKVSRAANSNDGAGGTNGRFEFPVGTLSGEYRPAAINFTPNYVVNNPVSIIVNHIDATPEGTVGLPLDGGAGVKIGNYPPFYWLVNTTPSSLSSTQNFDIDLQANNLGVPYTDDAQLRIIRRQDGSATTNAWSLQGTAANYANYQVVDGNNDTTVVARTTSSQGGLVVQGSRFAIGVPTRAPSFTAPVVTTLSVNEGTETTVQFTADPNDVGETVTYSKVAGPEWAALNATTGLVTLTPDFTTSSVTPYTLTIRATDTGGSYSDFTLAITVVNVNRAPSFTATGAATQATASVANGVLYTFTYKAIDADGDALTYSVAVTPEPAPKTPLSYNISTALGTLSFTPDFADAGKVFTFTVTATDGTLTTTTTTDVTVTYAAAKGDVTGNGTIAADDASEILKYVVGLVTFSAEQMYAADVNTDGQVGALDAAWILYRVVNGTWPTAKMSAAMGSVEIGQLQKETEGYLLPINLAQTTGVLSVYAELDVDANVEVLGVTGRLPQGWISSSKIENGKVMFAFAGLEPLKEGSIAYISLRLKDKEANATIFGNANLNDGYSAALNSVTVREIPSEFALSQNYPNPFNPTTSIKFAIPENANVQLNVYNMLGQKVRTIMDGMRDAGYYTVNWDGTNDLGSKVSSGIYIYRISAGKYNATMKMNLLK